MRDLAADMDPAVVAEVDRRLADVAEEHAVRIPWAIESGSRAWGFPSPDSDYDCRFVFVRPNAAYLDPWPPRDVIETPLDAVFDVNGWDLVKAVKLAAVGNATIAEWLRSPIVYDGETDFRDQLLDLYEAVASPAAVVRHYQHVGATQWERSGAASEGPARLKGVFYALRPAAVLHWIATHGPSAPPMNLPQLLAEAPPPAEITDAIAELIARKSETRELGSGSVPTPVRAFVEQELGSDLESRMPLGLPVAEARSLAAQGFRDVVERWAPT